ncbi:MAG TPA: hypothetical protein PLO37_10810 [Candidatus Hydrogenedentes bacterium]|nr:hypothetical protein [Candidatus Hydrogenedentota bacterium]HPG67327.1 hypothetical protein [Candidatus Hydrogenedentota bacterium]
MIILAGWLSQLCIAASAGGIVAHEPPSSPHEGEWAFVDALAAPMEWHPHWNRREKATGEADLGAGVNIEAAFADPEGLLDAAYQDLNAFLRAVGVPLDGPFRIITEQVPTERFEAFRVVVSDGECRIQANDTEGIRRGVFFVQDALLASDGPFLALGETVRSPFIHTRISRCFFGPIKRPPMNRDELLDDVDYYPGDYLNRLAHDGVNGLWLTIEFGDICRTSLMPGCDPHREQRLEKLRKTVAKCRRYGIKVFLFCIEPRAMEPAHPLLKEHPEIGSKPFSGNSRLFCPFSDAAQTYLYEAVNGVFMEVPGLGGLINISFGERPTTCLSGVDGNWRVACPVCAEKQLGEILEASLGAMERGMHDANPDAKLISWLYVPGNGTGADRPFDPLVGIAQHTPHGVICQYNFESDGVKVQLGKERFAGDYWLSYTGPSAAFERVAAGVAEAGGEMGAKIQACCSHEVATVPYVPVPGLLYPKYRAMRRLGVTSVMQCWYFGNTPCVMNRAAATVLPFASEDLSEDAFLEELARRDWGPADAGQVVQAWRLFAEAYDNYPLTNAFQFYGPMHDGIAWPLHLKPVNRNLSPTWRSDYPVSGDRIGECFHGSHSFAEALELCRRMSETWHQGLDHLRPLKPRTAGDSARLNDITVAEALDLQFRSGYNILRFYDLREQLLYGGAVPKADVLDELRAIVAEEIDNATKLIALCGENPFLGFHSEAECYRYFPARLEWRIERLRDMLRTEFEEAAAAIAAGEDVFPEESGRADGPLTVPAARVGEAFASDWQNDAAWIALPRVKVSAEDPVWSWQAAHDGTSLYLDVECAPSEAWRAVAIAVAVEPSHLFPRHTFRADVHGKHDVRQGWLIPDAPWDFAAPMTDGRQAFRLRIPLDGFQGEVDPARPMRINLEVTYTSRADQHAVVKSWTPPVENPLAYRLGYGGDDPRTMGWLQLE